MTPDEQTISEILFLSDDKAKIAMIQLYAKQQCIAFVNWTLEDKCEYSATDENQWTHVETRKNITTAELYTQFIESQTIQ